MRENFENKVSIKGYVFNHDLKKRVTGPNSKNPGTSFITGELRIATDAQAMNVVPVSFTYVTETYKNGNPNATYSLLEQIIDGAKTFETDGTNGMKIRIDGDIETNDFVTRDGDIASPKRVRGSFAHPETGDIAKIGEASFRADMLIEKYVEIESDGNPSYGRLTGFVFNFRNDFIPVDLCIRNKDGMRYFDSLDISINTPVLTTVWGNIVSTTIEDRHEIESAFGAPTVTVTTRSLRSWDVVGAAMEPAEIGEDGAMSKEDITKGKAMRAAYLDDVRKRHEEYQNSKENAIAQQSASNASPTITSDYRF